MILKDPWLRIIRDYAAEKLLLVQISLSVSDKVAHVLEPFAPTPSERLKLIEELNAKDVPTVLRLQPVIPGLENEHIKVLDRALGNGASGVIVEPVRLTLDDIAGIARILGYNTMDYIKKYKWKKYGFENNGLYVPGDEWWSYIYREIKNHVPQSKPLTTCKYKPLSIDECCLFRITGSRKYALRPTVREISLGARPSGHVLSVEEFNVYPNPIRKILRIHHSKLLKTLKEKPQLSVELTRI